ncbi:hypothetical protein DRB96_39530 [Streptomyces sp. ICC1]|nr:hypothetical protein DRB89_39110 [Streptomyces sp. ICC4]AWZ17232.1 hypothetical protein DRB96_39530 [Streptomyces sp. ICC1]
MRMPSSGRVSAGTSDPSEWWIVNAKSGKCLEVENGWTHNGAPVQQWTCTRGVRHQMWMGAGPGPGGAGIMNLGTTPVRSLCSRAPPG